MKAKRIILSLCATVLLSLSILSLPLIKPNGVDPEPIRPNGGVITLGVDPEPIRP